MRGGTDDPRGAHSWLTVPHPSVAFSISVRPNGIRSVIIRLFTVHAGLTVNFWDMRPLSSSNLFFSELQRRFISPFWRLVCRARPQTGTLCVCSGSFHCFDHSQLLLSGASFEKTSKGGFYLQTQCHCLIGLPACSSKSTFIVLTVNCSMPPWRDSDT